MTSSCKNTIKYAHIFVAFYFVLAKVRRWVGSWFIHLYHSGLLSSPLPVKKISITCTKLLPRWRHQMETFSMSLCAGNSPVTGDFPSRRPVTRSFDVFCHLCLNKREVGNLRCHRAHYDVTVIKIQQNAEHAYRTVEGQWWAKIEESTF